MSQINYEVEVRKIYPDAFIRIKDIGFSIIKYAYKVRVPYLLIFSKAISGIAFNETYAWYDAYLQLKQQGKL